jgi:hypothetical protein
MEGDPSMSARSGPRHQHVRRVILPSGKEIEVVYFESPARPALPGAGEPDLHVCGGCGSELVYPLDWEEAGSAHWQVQLRCPNCEWSGTGVFEQQTVERFDEELDRGTEALLRDLRRMVRANMEEQVDRFVDALRTDLIVPDDF